MRTRFASLAGLVLLAAAPALTRAAAPVATQAADDKPALVVAFKSLNGLIDDAKYIAKLAGKEEEAKQAEKTLQGLVGGPKGLEGLDPKKPIGAYARVNEDDPQKSEVVVLLPAADEDALVSLLKRQDKLKVGDKGSDDVYKVTGEGLPFPLFLRFANKYAYVTGPTKAALSSERLLAPEKVLPERTTSLASVILRVQQIPSKYKDAAVSYIAEQAAEERKKEHGDETPAQKAFRLAASEEGEKLVKSIIEDGGDLSASIDVDQSAGELSAAVSFAGKPGSKLAESIADLGNKKSVGAGLVGADSALNGVLSVSLPEGLRKPLSEVIDELVKKGLAEAQEKGQREAAEAFLKAVLPTLKAGELDAGFSLHGPGPKGLYAVVIGLKVQRGEDIEKAVRDALEKVPAKDREKVKLDVAKVGGVNIHSAVPDDKGDENARKTLGDDPTVYFAFRDDAILLARGEGALDALKEAATATPKAGATVQLEASLSRLSTGASNQLPGAADAAKKAFKDGKKDKIRLVLEGGPSLTVKLSMDAPVVTFSALVQEAQEKAKPKDQDK